MRWRNGSDSGEKPLWPCAESEAAEWTWSAGQQTSQPASLWLPLICLPRGYRRPAIGRDRQDESCPESIHPTANGSHHTPVSLACPLTSDLTHFTQSNHHHHHHHHPPPLPRPIGPDTLQSEPRSYLKPSYPIRGSAAFCTDIVTDSRLMLGEITQMRAAAVVFTRKRSR